jgi:thiol:disulfide interchange protein DsbC
MRKLVLGIALATLIAAGAWLVEKPSWGFGNAVGTCGGNCTDCHSLKKEDAQELLNPDVKVLGVNLSAVGGLWEVSFEFQGRKGIVYIDFSKQNLIEGKVISLKTKTDVTEQRLSELNKVDVSKIPTGDALLLGRADAQYKAIVFDDPE